jgi:hypothetical protein
MDEGLAATPFQGALHQQLADDGLMDSSDESLESINTINVGFEPEDEPIGDINLEIVGLTSPTNGRFCCIHAVCGDFVKVGDVLRLVPTIVEIRGRPEPAIKLVKMVDGLEGCTVAFVPKVQSKLPIVLSNHQKYCIVKELYADSKSTYKRAKSYRNLGMAGVVVVGDYEQQIEDDAEQEEQE